MNQVGEHSAGRGSGLPWLIAGLSCLGVYVLVSAELDFFQMRIPFYALPICGREVWGPLPGSLMRYFDPEQLSSILWKMAALLPATVCLSIWVVSRFGARLDNPIAKVTRGLFGARGLVFFLAVSALATLLLVLFSLEARPLVDDEVAYLFQAKTYQTGRLFLPPPPAPDSIQNTFMIINKVWTTKYLWGHPLLLALGLVMGSPYVATISMSMASLALLYLVGLQTTTRSEASLAVAFMGLSPWFWFTSATLLSHVSMLFVLLLFLLGWFHLEKNPKAVLAIGLGFCLGWAFTVRPLTAIAWGVPFGLLMVRHTIREPRKWIRPLAGFVIGGGVILGAILYYDQMVTGNALTLPFAYYAPDERMGFGLVAPTGVWQPVYEHTLVKGIANAAVIVVKINSWLLGWPVSLLPFLGLMIARGSGHSPVGKSDSCSDPTSWKTSDNVWVAVILCVFAAHIFYYTPGISETGPFYYYELLVPMCFLAAKGLLTVYGAAMSWGHKQVARFISVFVTLSMLSSVLSFVPEKAVQIHTIYSQALYPFELSERSINEKALVFVAYRQPYGWKFSIPYPALDLDDRILFVQVKGEKIDREALRAFPDRKPYLLFFSAKKRDYVLWKLSSEDPCAEMDRMVTQEIQDRKEDSK